MSLYGLTPSIKLRISMLAKVMAWYTSRKPAKRSTTARFIRSCIPVKSRVPITYSLEDLKVRWRHRAVGSPNRHHPNQSRPKSCATCTTLLTGKGAHKTDHQLFSSLQLNTRIDTTTSLHLLKPSSRDHDMHRITCSGSITEIRRHLLILIGINQDQMITGVS